jgi:hypothetical protein
VFAQCQPLLDKLNHLNSFPYDHIFGSLPQQVQLIQEFYKIDQMRKHIIKKHISPGGPDCQDPCTLEILSNGAAYTSA